MSMHASGEAANIVAGLAMCARFIGHLAICGLIGGIIIGSFVGKYL